MSELEKGIAEYAADNTVRLHMPGHKGRKPGGILPEELYAYDVTELPFSDELFEADGGIDVVEKELSRLFGSGATLMSPFGATSCIQTMVSTVAAKGKIALPRNMHYSAFNAIGLANAREVILPVEKSEKTPAGILSPEVVEQAFKSDSDIATLFITSVDYYGYIADISRYSSLCKKYCKLLIVDNSHGAHLEFLKGYDHPIKLGADVVCDSIHKTIPAMTGSALLHFADPSLAAEGKKRMKRICSSSPSYPIMLSISAAAKWLGNEGKDAYELLAKRVSGIKTKLKKFGYDILEGEPCRLYVCGGKTSLSGDDILEALRLKGCVAEFADENGALLMFTPMNTERDLLRTEDALLSISQNNNLLPKSGYCDIIPQRAMSISEAMAAACECLAPEKCIGRIAAECIGRYPPGLPQIIIGEYIEYLPRGINMKNILVVVE